jgi:Mn2+/Fe2+ NRAMP family transporter
MADSVNNTPAPLHWLRRLGPGLITAAVVLGPGSIIASSRAGAEAHYDLVWVLVLAAIFMMTFTAMGARLGCALGESPLQYVANRWGRPLAALVGFSAFFVTAGFQFGGNLGVSVAMGEMLPVPVWLWPLFFTALALVFLFAAHETYRLIERTMIALVAVMLVTFTANLFFTGFSPAELAKGLVPRAFNAQEAVIGQAMFATTFSVVAAFYQAYLVRAKGWGRGDIKMAIRDSRVGIAMLCGIALIILIGAAEGLHGRDADFQNVGELTSHLRQTLGPWATVIFCVGLVAASFSSFIANALIGGALLADGLGLESRPNSLPTRVGTSLVMLIGCGVAVAVFLIGKGGTQSLLLAQVSTLIAAPLCAILLFGLTTSRAIMGDLRNRWLTIIIGGAGTALIIWFSLQLLRRLTGL